jgi:hypothetical protein
MLTRPCGLLFTILAVRKYKHNIKVCLKEASWKTIRWVQLNERKVYVRFFELCNEPWGVTKNRQLLETKQLSQSHGEVCIFNIDGF